MSKRSTIQASRRIFLKDLAAAGGAATVLVMARGALAAEAPEEPAGGAGKSGESRGYRVTPHIRKYYEKAGL
ncbi:MAG TPA: twin-arginine translocation signal domain-containing protein [Gammaproteobacteria bacterium]|nr:twin-arginine translocation signal domain-containing protein [Gammaproteobacteria bacterium]